MLTLYTTPLSANGRKVLAVSRHLGLAPKVESVDVYRGEGGAPAYRSLNPFGKIPTLVDGDLILWESNAILLYLSEAYGDFRLWARDARGRADVSRWLFWESSTWQPACVSVLAPRVGQLLSPESAPREPVATDWGDERLGSLLQFLDAHLRGRTFLAGDWITLADFSVGAMMMYARPAGFPFETFPDLSSWYRRIEDTEAWQATAAGPWTY
jgi:glutathione S-transferase